MSANNQLESAFPVNHAPSEPGTTLRDYFAAAALQGWLASFGPETPHPVESKTSHQLAAICYKQADAMLAERANGGAK